MTDLNNIIEANPRPKPAEAQSRVGCVSSYSFSFEVCHPSRPSMLTAKMNQVIFAIVGRDTFLRSKNHPQKMLAVVAMMPEHKEASVLERTEKLLVGSVLIAQT